MDSTTSDHQQTTSGAERAPSAEHAEREVIAGLPPWRARPIRPTDAISADGSIIPLYAAPSAEHAERRVRILAEDRSRGGYDLHVFIGPRAAAAANRYQSRSWSGARHCRVKDFRGLAARAESSGGNVYVHRCDSAESVPSGRLFAPGASWRDLAAERAGY